METQINYVHTTHTHNPKSANKILPFIFDIFKPNSVLDIGCGNGSWLKVFKDNGVSEVVGVDGINIHEDELFITKKEFLVQDLSKKLDLERKFDMVLSLEVAEHLSDSAADIFVSNLIRHSNIILFSAAIPGQGGQYHLNEQWPQYWNEKFRKKGFEAYDILRLKFWEDKDVLWWYKQNMMFFVKQGAVHPFNKFEATKNILPIIHPNLYNKKNFKPKFLNSKKEVLKSLLSNLKYLIKG